MVCTNFTFLARTMSRRIAIRTPSSVGIINSALRRFVETDVCGSWWYMGSPRDHVPGKNDLSPFNA